MLANQPARLPISLLATATLTLALLPACSVNVRKQENGDDKQVDIKTPVGAIHVNKEADASDAGMPVYPGARLRKNDPNDNGANVNISSFGFGIKVVALEYESDDAPEKLIAYYKDQLHKYGVVLECHSSSDFDLHASHSNSGSGELTCDKSSGNHIELKVGTKDNQHVVSIQPEGSGSKFALVYVRTHGKDADI
jgi:hypothetical protein